MADEAQPSPPAGRRISIARLTIGFLQGVVLCGLSEASTHHLWPAAMPPLYGALALVLTFAPVIVIGGLGRIRTIPLAVWTLIAAVILALFAWHDIDAGIWSGLPGLRPRLVPAFQVFLFAGIFVFVGHHLVGPADEARKLVAPYPLYFDWAWKDAVQIGLSLAFVGVLWAALELGAALFRLIGIDAVGKVLEKDWFCLPVPFTAFAAAVQLTDVRVALIRGVRTVGLVLLSWLLPVMTVIVLAFLAALPFTGLAPLFNTRSGASTVLSAGAALVVLLSAAYEDGASPTPAVLRWAGRAAGLAMVPLVLIAADALWLRVGEYGLTPPRIEAIACAVVAAGFAAGYALGAVRRRGPWMQSVELTNVVMARAVMLAILLIFTPIADPARLAVGDQMSRLLAGKTPPAKFDFDFLRFRAGQYGAAALTQIEGLKGSPANLALAQEATNAVESDAPTNDDNKTFVQRLTVYPKGTALPPTFASQDWTHPPADLAGIYEEPTCYSGGECEAYVLDVDGDGSDEVLLGPISAGDTASLEIYRRGSDGFWRDDGSLTVQCPGAIGALRAGQFSRAPAIGNDLVIAGRRTQLMRRIDACPTPTAASNSASNAASHDTER